MNSFKLRNWASLIVLFALIAIARSQNCQIGNEVPKYGQDINKSSKIVSSEDNKVAIQFMGHLYYKSEYLNDSTVGDRYVPLVNIEQVKIENGSYFDIVTLKMPCAEIELYLSNNTVSKMSLVSIDVLKLKADLKFKPKRRNKPQRGDCNFLTPREFRRRSRFLKALECWKDIEISCPIEKESEEQLGGLHLQGLKIELDRPEGAPRNEFATKSSEFTKCMQDQKSNSFLDI